MPTLYCDFENGNDDFAGTSFAVLAQGTNGRITSTTFSSATASFPNDGSLINQYLSIFNGSIYAVYRITAWVSATSLTIAAISGGTALANQAVDRQYYIGGRWRSLTNGATALRTIPGDTVRIMGSPAPTSLGQTAVWTSQALQATKNINGTTNTTPISVNVPAHGYSTGDTVVITGHSTHTNANGTWEITVTGANFFTLDGSVGNATGGTVGTVRLRNNTRVMLTTAVTQNIASTGPGRAAWTASANVTTGLGGSSKEGEQSNSIAIGAAFTTGLAAYWTLPAALDLSAYQQVSFWIQQFSGTLGLAGAVDLRLCSDTVGTTAVHTISIPALAALNRWMPVTVDFGTNLNSSIQSIAFYVNIDNASQGFLLSNIIACKASSEPDSLTLTSLIGKNTTGETFWGIQSINGRRVMLDADTNATPTSTSVRGYYGTSGTVTTWKRETIKLGPAASSNTTLQTINESGTAANLMTFSGGWDRTNMSTQNIETWLDGVNGNGRGLNIQMSYIMAEKIAFVRCNSAIFFSSGSTSTVFQGNFIAANNTSTAIDLTTSWANIDLTVGSIVACNVAADMQGSNITNTKITLPIVNSNNANAILLNGTPSQIITGNFANNGGRGVFFSSTFQLPSYGTLFRNCTFRDNNGGAIDSSGTNGPSYLMNCQVLDTSEVSNPTSALLGLTSIYSHNHDGVVDNHKVFLSYGLVSSATDQRQSASGISWKIQPTNVNLSQFVPLRFSLAKVACSANNLVTIKAWMYRDNSGLTMRLVCKGGQIAGVPNDVVSALTTTNAWEEETITFTPTEAGVVEITAEAWGGTTFSGWVDDMTITQA